MTEAINRFEEEHAFLSNFFPSTVRFDGTSWPTVEHAFQAAKTNDPEERNWIRNAGTPGVAKRRGRSVKLRKDWESVKLDVMRELLRSKFSDPTLRRMLLDTGDSPLLEGNMWNDRFWGVCLKTGKGQNHLGGLLMSLREELRNGVRVDDPA